MHSDALSSAADLTGRLWEVLHRPHPDGMTDLAAPLGVAVSVRARAVRWTQPPAKV
jgi:hypothetical protein